MAGFFVSQLNLMESTVDAPYITYAVGAYDIFYQLFGVLGLYNVNAPVDTTFTGIINYAASAVFELVESDNEKLIRFGSPNGTDNSVPLQYFPILGSNSTSITYDDFINELSKSAIQYPKSWCNACSVWSLDMCQIYIPQYINAAAHSFDIQTSSLTQAGAGGIGAGATLGVVVLVLAALWLIFRRESPSANSIVPPRPTDVGSQTSVAKQEV